MIRIDVEDSGEMLVLRLSQELGGTARRLIDQDLQTSLVSALRAHASAEESLLDAPRALDGIAPGTPKDGASEKTARSAVSAKFTGVLRFRHLRNPRRDSGRLTIARRNAGRGQIRCQRKRARSQSLRSRGLRDGDRAVNRYQRALGCSGASIRERARWSIGCKWLTFRVNTRVAQRAPKRLAELYRALTPPALPGNPGPADDERASLARHYELLRFSEYPPFSDSVGTPYCYRAWDLTDAEEPTAILRVEIHR